LTTIPERHIINSLNHREIIIMPKSQINSDIDQSKLTEDELDDLLDQQSMSIHAEIRMWPHCTVWTALPCCAKRPRELSGKEYRGKYLGEKYT